MKSIFVSKTFWLNVIAGAIALGSGQLGFTLDPKLSTALIAIANIAMRFLTNSPVSVTGQP